MYNSMKLSPSWEDKKSSDIQEIPCILWNLEVHYWIHKSPPPIRILSEINLGHAPSSSSLK
jgi:hypothetical protein